MIWCMFDAVHMPASIYMLCNVYKEKMFTIEIKDGRDAPLKPSVLYFYVPGKELHHKLPECRG